MINIMNVSKGDTIRMLVSEVGTPTRYQDFEVIGFENSWGLRLKGALLEGIVPESLVVDAGTITGEIIKKDSPKPSENSHREKAESLLKDYERRGGYATGLQALIHAVLSLDSDSKS